MPNDYTTIRAECQAFSVHTDWYTLSIFGILCNGMSKIWLLILTAGLATLLFTDPNAAVSAMTAGSTQAVSLAINLVAVYGLWLGLFGIIERLGLADRIAKILHPVIRLLFKDVDATTEKYITMNMSANLLGLGNASTPMGIGAITRMSEGRKTASQNMIMLVVISATSLQLLPSTVIGMRAAHGSVAPADFLLASTVATVLSTAVGIALVKLCGKLFPDAKAEQKALLHDGAAGHKRKLFAKLRARIKHPQGKRLLRTQATADTKKHLQGRQGHFRTQATAGTKKHLQGRRSL